MKSGTVTGWWPSMAASTSECRRGSRTEYLEIRRPEQQCSVGRRGEQGVGLRLIPRFGAGRTSPALKGADGSKVY